MKICPRDESPRAPSPLGSTLVAGKYRLKRLLGRGEMGAVAAELTS